jgi:hypothetical protein
MMQMKTCFTIEVTYFFFFFFFWLLSFTCARALYLDGVLSGYCCHLYGVFFHSHFDHAISDRVDPAVNDELCSVAAADLEHARNSSGTDHDW